MIDSHCHLDLNAFAQDIDSVLADSRKAGVTRFLIPGTTVPGWQRQHTLASANPDIDIAYGLHPYFLSPSMDDNKAQLRALESQLASSHASTVAVGEMGLDGVVDIPMDTQQQVLEYQLHLAQEAALPVILHHRKTHHLLHKALKDTGFNRGGVIHAFSGNAQIARQYTDQGFLLGIGGTVTYPRGSKTREAIKSTGLEHLILETDAPDMPMSGRQGQRNSPAYLRDVVIILARLFEKDAQSIIARTTDTYYSQFQRRSQE
ncbi:TatD family hydrolase [Alteromonas halophila]|uniref:Deoxyribonuclease n=1 Tax=Alteromonas halophila TaxID=516698 RepID=A0A918JNG5_9ALTE|nr:TatD family hydrolase [Alteromonas halophila]GGW85949.1 deoxyribonuclease [Alteromonas halophila]